MDDPNMIINAAALIYQFHNDGMNELSKLERATERQIGELLELFYADHDQSLHHPQGLLFQWLRVGGKFPDLPALTPFARGRVYDLCQEYQAIHRARRAIYNHYMPLLAQASKEQEAAIAQISDPPAQP